MFKSFRFIDEPYLKPCENMALDEALLEHMSESSLPTFRLYTWENDAFSIGRFQDITSIHDFGNFGDNFTRRVTGGGLLLHGFDISYSLLIPIAFVQNKNVKESYEYLCEFLLHFYKKLGFSPSFAKDIQGIDLLKNAFCQVGYEAYDIIIEGKKIGGNAQKRTKNFIYQHGSIPINVDSRPFSGTSLSAIGINQSVDEIKELLKQSFCESFRISLKNIPPNEKELATFQNLHVNKYSTKEWKYDKQT